MTDQELLKVAEAVLLDAIETAEFTRLSKDLVYVQVVADKTEKLRAKVQLRPVMRQKFSLVNGRIYCWCSYDPPAFFPQEVRTL